MKLLQTRRALLRSDLTVALMHIRKGRFAERHRSGDHELVFVEGLVDIRNRRLVGGPTLRLMLDFAGLVWVLWSKIWFQVLRDELLRNKAW